MGRYMAKCENLEPPREGLIRQELISYEKEDGKLVKRTTVRVYDKDGIDYQDHQVSEPLVWERGQVY